MFSDYLTKNYPEATKFLTNAIGKDKLANSYIFIGKNINDISLMVANLAKILNCHENKEIFSLPCEKCINCRWLESNTHPQALLTIIPDPKNKKEQVKIDSIRDLLNTLKITSEFFRVVFFKDSNLNTLTTESCNLLLKVVEETPKNILFIFANTTKNDILPTIRSRSQIIYINKKIDSLKDLFSTTPIEDTSIVDYNVPDYYSALEKTRKTLEYLNNYEINLKEYLLSVAEFNYEANKHTGQKEYLRLFENISKASLKLNSFMQPKIVLEDLYLSQAKNL